MTLSFSALLIEAGFRTVDGLQTLSPIRGEYCTNNDNSIKNIIMTMITTIVIIIIIILLF